MFFAKKVMGFDVSLLGIKFLMWSFKTNPIVLEKGFDKILRKKPRQKD